MNADIPQEVHKDSWAKDFTPTIATRRTLLYLQCGGSFSASASYKTRRTVPLASFLCLQTTDGAGVVHYQGNEYTLTAHTLMVIDCRFPHTYQTAPCGFWKFNWIHFGGNACEGYTERLQTISAPTAAVACLNAFHAVFQHLHNYTPLTELVTSGALVRLCLTLAEESSQQATGAPFVLPIISSAIAIIEEECLSSLSLEALAHKVDIDKFKLSHLFKEQIGCSPHEYLLFCRMNRAKTLLRTTDCTISSIAEQCGFDSASYFGSFFKEREGITPLVYRKQFTKNAADDTTFQAPL